MPIVLMGDWNFVGDGDECIREAEAGHVGGDGLAHKFDALFERCAEVWQPLPTFGRWGGSGMAVAS